MKNKTSSIEGIINVALIKNYIKENKLTQKAFASKCNINIWNLKRVLDGKSHFNTIYLFKIAKEMKIHVKELFYKK